MRKSFVLRSLGVALSAMLALQGYAQPSNDNCSGATSITTNTCNSYNIKFATTATPAGSCGSATATTTYDMWFRFTATSTSTAISLSNYGSNLTAATTYVQVMSGASCAAVTSVVCSNASAPVIASGLTVGTSYYLRVYVVSNPNGSGSANRYDFDMCLQDAPSNDNCNTPIILTPATTCTNTAGTLAASTASSPAVSSGCAGTPGGDVWYQFTAQTTNPTISMSSIGSSFSAAGVRMQLYSGSCGSFSPLACTSGTSSTLSMATASVVSGGLTPGQTYFIRVYSPTTSPIGNNWDYNICITQPAASRIDYSRSYVNISRGNTGGTVTPGDTLEMRVTVVIQGSGSSIDSLSYTDTLYRLAGLRMVPGSISLRTNEGKVYQSMSDAFDSDNGWAINSGGDTIVRINFGANATAFARGRLNNTSRPSVFGSTCIIMATYRVVVYASYNSLINFKSGLLTYRDVVTGNMNNIRFDRNNLMVYQSPGLCPNAVSATNALGAEDNGTFGTPSGPAPLARNRGTTPFTSYQYGMFTATANAPQDYYYGITNNTSGRFTTVNTWAKPDNNSYRIFNVWDITGDHTGATNTARGNPACDTTRPVSPTNPCGYMLVINSAYKADTAFTYSVTNLCPNTYYEISAWFKNVCYKCGCDSTGAGSSVVGYIPTDVNDSSGVRPNIAFDVNGVDYYTTGDLRYTGVTQGGSDSSNTWVKRGFVYLTGPSETSFMLTLRNNAPGGGGNDWALDDISVATCLPNMSYSPSLNPTSCINNTITINDTIRSYFNNYNNYRWQRSTDNGNTWVDVAGANGSATPVWNGSSWEYVTSYTVPPSQTTLANNGDRYRVVTATTMTNLTNTNCQVTDGVSIIRLNVIDCGVALSTKLLGFTGRLTGNKAQLTWTTSREGEPLRFTVEKSLDGIYFQSAGALESYRNYNAETNQYTFTDSADVTGKTRYRILVSNASGRGTYSRIIQLDNGAEAFEVRNVVNPFSSALSFEVTISKDSRIDVALLNAAGMPVHRQSFAGYTGVNNLTLEKLESLAPGVYVLQVANREQSATRKVIKK